MRMKKRYAKRQFRIPGPVHVPIRVWKAATKAMKYPISHRSKEFKTLLFSVTDKLKKIAQTKNDLFIFNSAGTGGMQAALSNCFQPGEKVLFLSNGFFGERFVTIGGTQRVFLDHIEHQWAAPIDLDLVKKRVESQKDLRGVVMVLNETSVAMTNDVRGVAELLNDREDILFIVDANSGMGGIDCPVDNLGIDIVMFTSQKAFMCPPGAMILTASPKVWKKVGGNWNSREHYYSFKIARDLYDCGETFGTPVLPTFFALDEATDMILDEGLDNVFQRHASVAAEMRKSLSQFKLLAAKGYESNTVTAFQWPGDPDQLEEFLTDLDEEYNLKIARGQEKMRGKIFRIGHMGDITMRDVRDIANRVKKCFNALSSK